MICIILQNRLETFGVIANATDFKKPRAQIFQENCKKFLHRIWRFKFATYAWQAVNSGFISNHVIQYVNLFRIKLFGFCLKFFGII